MTEVFTDIFYVIEQKNIMFYSHSFPLSYFFREGKRERDTKVFYVLQRIDSLLAHNLLTLKWHKINGNSCMCMNIRERQGGQDDYHAA